MDADLHRITQRCQFYYGYICSGNDAHIQKMLAKRSCPADFGYDAALSRFQFFQIHICLFSRNKHITESKYCLTLLAAISYVL